MRRRDVYRGPRGSYAREAAVPTWPHDTEIMISRALSLMKDLGGE